MIHVIILRQNLTFTRPVARNSAINFGVSGNGVGSMQYVVARLKKVECASGWPWYGAFVVASDAYGSKP